MYLLSVISERNTANCRVKMVRLVYLIAVVVLPLIPGGCGLESASDYSSTESRLINTLLERYKTRGKVARPLLNSSHIMHVSFGLRLVHLDIDAREQVMTTSVWTRYAWTDQVLTWNKADYDGVEKVVLPVNKIWIPDIVPVNTAIMTIDEQPADATVTYNGLVFWAPQRKYSSACLINITEYPYDRHMCDVWFQSLANPSTIMNITPYSNGPLDLDTYLTSYKNAQEWEIVSNASTWHQQPREEGMILMWSRRAALRFRLTIQRRAGFQGILLIVPCTLLSMLIPLIFCFPPERPDRHSLAMSLFASLTILLFMVNDVAPPSASFVPRLTLYYCCNLLVLLMATCCSAAVVNINKREETRQRVPKWAKKVLISGLGKMLCFQEKLRHLDSVRRASMRPSDMDPITVADAQRNPCLEDGDTPSTTKLKSTSVAYAHTDDPTIEDCSRMIANINRKLSFIELRIMEQKSARVIPDTEVPPDLRAEWRTLAMILDRLLFIIFIAAVVVALAVFHPRVPQ